MTTTATAMTRGIKCSHPIGSIRWSATSYSEDPPHLHRQSSCTSIEWSATRERDPPHSLHTYRHPAPLGRPEGTALTLPGASTAKTLYILRPAPQSGQRTHHPTHHRPMPSIHRHTIAPITHTTRREARAYKEDGCPP